MKVTVGMLVTALAIGGAILYLNSNPRVKDEVCGDMKKLKKDVNKNLQNMM
jgi:hypothetical protein